MTSADDSSFAAILAASVAASEPDEVRHSALPEDLRNGEAAVDGCGRRGQRLCCVRHGAISSGRVTLTSLSGLSVGFDAGDVDGLDLADVGQDGVELAGEAVQLGIGQRQPGQPGQVGYLVAGDLGHERKA